MRFSIRLNLMAATLMTSFFGATALAQPEPAPAAAPAATAAASWSDRNERAIVVATNEGNVDPGMVNSLVQLLSQAFVAKGVSLVTSAELRSPVNLDDTLGEKAQAAGASRIFVLHVLRLNEKTLLQVEERTPDNHSVYLSSLTPGDVESSDEILPRLVDSVLRRVPASDNAEYSNVTKQETGTHNRSHFTLAVPGGGLGGQALGGLELGYQFETAQFALGAFGMIAGGTGGSGIAVTGVYGLYYFLPTNVTPYVGAGMGFGGTWSNDGGGVGAIGKVELGVEILRFNHTHFDLGGEVYLPFYNVNNDTGSGSTYQPAYLLKARVVF